MKDNNNDFGDKKAPWREKYVDQIKSVIVCPRVFSIGKSAFRACYRLKSVVLSDSINTIRDKAFHECIIWIQSPSQTKLS